MAVPQNIEDDLNAVDSALSSQAAATTGVASATQAVATANTNLNSANAALTTAQQAVSLTQQQLLTDIAVWISAGGASLRADLPEMAKKLVATMGRLPRRS